MLTIDQKKLCLKMLENGVPKRQVYEEVVRPNTEMTFKSFDKKRFAWKKRLLQDREKLDAANLDGRFAPYAATVQVDGRGNVVQAWIKQHTDQMWDDLLQAVKDNTPVRKIEPVTRGDAEGMLEIPLFDMHFGIADIDYYRSTLGEILAIVGSKHWEKIVIPVGQDLFHNDSIKKGITTKGTPIDRVDLKQAVLDAKEFYFNLIDAALGIANEVSVIYSPGNHDKTVGWLFAQILKVRYGDIVDDSIRERKCVWWKGCFIGITHGDKGNDTAAGLRGKFTMEFAALFAAAKVREIHLGHLHREGESRDEYGCLVRRVCSKGMTDEWSDDQGYMAHKRFMLFEWQPDRLAAIYYV